MLLFCLAVGLVTLVVLLAYIIIKGWPRLDSRLFTEMPSSISPETAGAQSAITGTLWIIVFTALWSLPVGILAAIYLEEYADPNRWWNRLIEINLLNLAAVPSIVFGILGLAFISRGLGFGPTVLDRFADARPAGATRRRHRQPRSHPRRSAVDSCRLAGARCNQMADDLAASTSCCDSRHLHRGDLGAVAGHRRSGATADARHLVCAVQP